MTVFWIDKYQTGVLSTTFDSITNSTGDWLNVDHVRRRFFRDVFLRGCCTQTHKVGQYWFFGVAAVNTFSSVHRIMLTPQDEHFSNRLEWNHDSWRNCIPELGYLCGQLFHKVV